jgi:hypothetical protein
MIRIKSQRVLFIKRDLSSQVEVKGRNKGTIVAMALVVVAVIALAAILVAFKAESSSHSTTLTASATLTSSQGMRLVAGLNTTKISVGHELFLTISLFNTASRTNSIRSASDWPFAGIPVFVSPPCYFFPPLEFVVLKGHYAKGNLSVSGIRGPMPYICMEGVSIYYLIFRPNDNNFTMTGIYDVTNSNQTLGPYRAAGYLSISGYWDQFTDSQMQNSTFYTSFQEYFSYGSTSPKPQHAFTPGLYTVAVADEWGDLVMVYFTVD